MKKFIGLLMGLLLIFAVSGSASAIPYIDVYDAGPEGIIGINMNKNNTRISWTFDITDDGFNPVTQDVTSASVKLHFSDYDPDFWPFKLEETATLILGTNNFVWEVDTEWSTFTVTSLITLSDSGTLNCIIFATDGDFWFNEAVLFAEGTEVAQAPVPEPATMLLFGLGILGLAGVSRKKCA